MRNRLIRFVLIAVLATCAIPAWATLEVFACEPEWGALVTELAGDNAKVYVATTSRDW